jgi:omega-6 fatty acid desaturase (delta-12 desaturase)
MSGPSQTTIATQRASERDWMRLLAPYARPIRGKSVWQLAHTAALFAACYGLALFGVATGRWWLMALVILPSAGLLLRLFIIQHDCGHGSFFRSHRANELVGGLLGVVTMTPYRYWKKTHHIHHSSSGDLGRRELGDVSTLTVDEYNALPLWKRWIYRMYRSVFGLFVLGPIYQFIVKHRYPFDLPRTWKREWMSILGTNLGLLAMILGASVTVGVGPYLVVQLSIVLLAGAAGIWLFYIQHQFEDTYWRPSEDWTLKDAALQGSSYYDLPRILRWFTGNIGLHHVHHLCAGIPNYRLQECFDKVPDLHRVHRLTLWSSLGCARLKLWDEKAQRLVAFRQARRSRQSTSGSRVG